MTHICSFSKVFLGNKVSAITIYVCVCVSVCVHVCMCFFLNNGQCIVTAWRIICVFVSVYALCCYGNTLCIVFQCRNLGVLSWSWWCHFPAMDKPCSSPWSKLLMANLYTVIIALSVYKTPLWPLETRTISGDGKHGCLSRQTAVLFEWIVEKMCLKLLLSVCACSNLVSQ